MTELKTQLWNDMGIIPPIDESEPTSINRSPYQMNIVQFVSTFAFSQPRRNILRGFLNFRKALADAGLIDGFQWVDGSFTENVEMNLKRPPNDVDVVTFFNLQPGDTDEIVIARNQSIFDQSFVKQTFYVDSYFESLEESGAYLVSKTVYWYSMWAHKRDLSWKGFVQIPLSPQLDAFAVTILDTAEAEEANHESF